MKPNWIITCGLPFVPLRGVIDSLNDTFLKYFTPGMNVTIYKMLSLVLGPMSLQGFRGSKAR